MMRSILIRREPLTSNLSPGRARRQRGGHLRRDASCCALQRNVGEVAAPPRLMKPVRAGAPVNRRTPLSVRLSNTNPNGPWSIVSHALGLSVGNKMVLSMCCRRPRRGLLVIAVRRAVVTAPISSAFSSSLSHNENCR